MNQEQKNISCSLCHAYLFEEDDVVYCPVCGAPHHRECYNSIGHCALEQLHGTEQQYDKIKRKEENQQKTQQEEKSKTEYRNKTDSFKSRFENTYYFDLLGGVPKDYQIDDGVTAEEAKNFVISNTMRYIPKFAKLSKHKKTSWNFMAFLFPCGWFLSRKMYKYGIITGILSIISTLFSLPLNNVLINLGIMDSMSYYDMAQRLMENMPNINPAVIFVSFIGMWISIATSILCGIFGDYLYKVHTVNTIKQIKTESIDLERDFRKKGGVSLVFFLIGTLAVQYIPSIIAVFI